MADRYWRGLATDLWDGTAGTKWAATVGGAGGAAVPTAADDVFFDGTSANCTISGSRVAKSINCTGYTGTLAGASTPLVTISGSLTLVSGMTLSFAMTAVFDATGTIISAGKTLGGVIVNGSGITVTLGDALTISGVITVTQGTFTTSASNYSVTASQLASSNSNTRTITLNGSTVSLSSATPIDFTTSTNLTFNAGTSQINISDSAPTINGVGLTFYNVNCTSTTAGARTLTGNNTFNDLTLTASATGLSILSSSDNQTINGTFTCSGSSAIARGMVRSNVIGTTRTFTVANLSATDCDFRDITIAGAAAGSSPTRAGNCGGNSGITFPAAKNVYWNLAGTQDWNATAWATGTGGTPAVNNFPLAQDTAIFDDAGAAGTVNFGSIGYNISAINAANRTSAMTLNHSTQNLYGSITLGSGVTVTGTGSSFVVGRGTIDITTAGKTITFGLNIQVFTGTVRLLDAYNASGSIALTSGTFDANNYNVTITGFGSSGSVAKTITMGSGLWTMTGAGTSWNLSGTNHTLNKNTADILFSNNTTSLRFFVGAGLVYNKLTLGGTTSTNTTQFTGNNTFSEIASTKTVAHTLSFAGASTTTVGNWTVVGSSGNLVSVTSTSGGAHNLVKTGGGSVNTDYLSITNSSASPSITWYAGANSTNVSNNSGWIFTSNPTTNFAVFFLI